MRRQYIVDTLASVCFWVPTHFLINLLILRLEWWQIAGAAASGVAMNFALGGLYGRFLNLVRRLLK